MRALTWIVCLLFCSGCFFLRKSPPVPLKEIEITGTEVDVLPLKQGGKLALTPFKAGPRASADEQTDRLSLMVLKGISEGLEAGGHRLSLTDQAVEADFVTEGYIEEFSRKRIAVSGEIYLKKTGIKALTFAYAMTINAKRDDPMEVAYHVGVSIGNYIVEHAGQEAT